MICFFIFIFLSLIFECKGTKSFRSRAGKNFFYAIFLLSPVFIVSLSPRFRKECAMSAW
ncbi:hypothetical protein HMPREF9441_01599 [Paraprevotella clara YIT 11840]|uniref:Uncharacterized protein n=1 Tax=Paraprevotella clara YIT 11840 TaxID=762968 RepID=G5SQG0_9BACT|nr:hypothetical protein HMPREF9441_01599 [Paraprevotella clara YIT 11840]